MAAACSQAVDDQGEATESLSEAIIDGRPASSPKYEAIGAIGFYFEGAGVLNIRCSATLIDKKAIVTARHCTPEIDLALANGLTPVFVVGESALGEAEQAIPITGYVNAPAEAVNGGLLFDGGRDVAVAYLESAPRGVEPAKLGKFKSSFVGKRFQVAGYGERAPEGAPGGFYGERYTGSATARTLGGAWYPALFNDDFSAFLEWYFTDSPFSSGDPAEAAAWWEVYQLEPGFELYAGGAPGDAVPCNGDSGGPLFLSQGKDITLYGVFFAVENTVSTVCGFGGGYVVFNDTILDFVKDAIDDDDSKPKKHKRFKIKSPVHKHGHFPFGHFGFSKFPRPSHHFVHARH